MIGSVVNFLVVIFGGKGNSAAMWARRPILLTEIYLARFHSNTICSDFIKATKEGR